MAQAASALGIRIPKPYGLVSADGRTGIRSEFIDGESLSQLLVSRPERYAATLSSYLCELKRFHETKAAAGSFPGAKGLYLEKIDKLSGSDWYTAEELEKMKELVLSVPDRDTLVCGDFHPENILVRNGELYFVDLGDMCTGHPVFDFAMIANTHFIIPSVNPAYAEKYFAVPAGLMLRLWDDLFNAYFVRLSPERQRIIKKGILAFAILRQGLSPADGRVFPEHILKSNTAAVKKKLLPEIDTIIGSIDW